MNFKFQRILRTLSSEVFGIFTEEEDQPLGRFDLHFAANGVVNGLVVLEQELDEATTEALIAAIDNDYVETVDLNSDQFEITLVVSQKSTVFGRT
jgi:ABC-type tungstate transport system substrate-binding protein